MSYEKQEIKEGITLHTINTKNFKTNLIAVFLTTPLKRENVTLDTLISLILKRGTANMKSQEEISIALENMYGAEFDCGIEKTGDNHVMKFYLESLNDEYLPKNENLLNESLNKIIEIIFNPLVESGGFKEEYLHGEKEKLKQIIQGKKDNKGFYALNRCIEEMYKGKPYGLYKYGYIEDIDKITANGLYEYYKKLIQECKIDIFISGNIENNVIEEIRRNENINKLNARKPHYIINNEQTEKKEENGDINTVEESMEVSQGKLVIGLNINNHEPDSKHTALLYNAILGGTANSKMFQNVREKESLAYSAGSNYLRQKNNIFVRCGIEIENYEKAVKIIKEQIEDMKIGNFTEEDINNGKKYIISTIKGIPDEQDTEISYYLGQELSNSKLDVNTYMDKINNVSKENITKLANDITIDTIYFLKN